MNPKVLIICKEQFGYFTDIERWSEYLKDEYSVTTLSIDARKSKIHKVGVHSIYSPFLRYKTPRGLLFVLVCYFVCLFFKGQIILCYFRHCDIIKKLLPKKKIILDIRTQSIEIDERTRSEENKLLTRYANTFDFVTVISDNVRDLLSVPIEKSAIIPLGGDALPVSQTRSTVPHLLYVGTLSNRDIHKTVLGLAKAIQLFNLESVTYDIVGSGDNDEEQQIHSLISQYGLENVVRLHGFVRHDLLSSFFSSCNIGISFVPITDYYNHQPPTKTFEYILSGLYTIATKTAANSKIITDVNGTLIEDTPEEFAEGLARAVQLLPSIDNKTISQSLSKFEWKNIVTRDLIPALKRFDQ